MAFQVGILIEKEKKLISISAGDWNKVEASRRIDRYDSGKSMLPSYFAVCNSVSADKAAARVLLFAWFVYSCVVGREGIEWWWLCACELRTVQLPISSARLSVRSPTTECDGKISATR